jgi:hypothetical protein
MPIFPDPGPPPASSSITVDVPELRVYRSIVTASVSGTDDPTWGSWAAEPLWRVTGIFRGSSFGGMSYAKFTLAPGRPAEAGDTRVEDENAATLGDRIAVAAIESGTPRVLFAGYVTQARILIEDDREVLTIYAAGPEWLWGDTVGGGSYIPIIGQVRRTGAADDTWANNPASVVTAFADLTQFTADQAIFNPDGRRNMSWSNVEIDSLGDEARCWEVPERNIAGALRCAFWTQKQAAKTLLYWYNDPDRTGIANPDFDLVDIDDTTPLRNVSVEGLGLWAALKKVLEPEYGFYVVAKLSGVSGATWSGFELIFFKRSSGPSADLSLNALGTSVEDALASVARLESIKDIGKTVTQVSVLGKRVTHLRLRYFGGFTPSAAAEDKQVMLQHGWTSADGDLLDYAEGRVEQTGADPHDIIDTLSISNAGKTDEWNTRYVVGGPQFAKYQHAFRLFVWNESGEWGGEASGSPEYGLGLSSYAYQKPDLTDICDEPDNAGVFCRRRRPALDSLYLIPGLDAWQRVPPTLYISDDVDATPWIRVPTSMYRLDPDRCAVWITAHDLATWTPLMQQDQYADDGTRQTSLGDGRTFMTLLYTGKLRMLLECSVEADWALRSVATRITDAGSPFVREAAMRRDQDFIASQQFVDGVTPPSGLSVSLVDTSTDAQKLADLSRNSTMDQQTHASILVEADWPEQLIGSFIAQTSGRVIDLTGGPTSNGALIVALHLDPVAMKWELLTESEALFLRDFDRVMISRKKILKRSGRAGISGRPEAG